MTFAIHCLHNSFQYFIWFLQRQVGPNKTMSSLCTLPVLNTCICIIAIPNNMASSHVHLLSLVQQPPPMSHGHHITLTSTNHNFKTGLHSVLPQRVVFELRSLSVLFLRTWSAFSLSIFAALLSEIKYEARSCKMCESILGKYEVQKLGGKDGHA